MIYQLAQCVSIYSLIISWIIIVDNVFIPAITDGHMHMHCRRTTSAKERWFGNSRITTERLVEYVNNQDNTAPIDIEQRMPSRRKIVNTREERCNTILQQLRERMSQEGLRAKTWQR